LDKVLRMIQHIERLNPMNFLPESVLGRVLAGVQV
jgi:hypothetical protein